MRKQSSVMRASNVDSVLSAVRTDEMDSLDSCFKAGVVVHRKDSCSDCARGYPAPCCRPLFAAEAGFHLGFTLIFRTIETCSSPPFLPSQSNGFHKVSRPEL